MLRPLCALACSWARKRRTQTVQARKVPRSSLALESLEGRDMCSVNHLAAALPTPSPGVAGVNLAAPRIINGQPTSGFPSVGLIGDSQGSFCSGTLIAPRYVLTAAHCAEGVAATQGRFIVNGTSYATSRIFIHPQYRPNAIGSDSANDLAIYELAQPVTGITPTPINRAVPAVGQMLTLVGFGGGGTGTTGTNGDFGIKRVGTTPIDAVSATLIHWNFDNNSEANTAPGDSGGPALLLRSGVYYVAGVTSGGDNADASLGDHSFDTRVDVYASWIDSIVNATPTPPPPTTDDIGNTFSAARVLTLSAAGAATGSGRIEVTGDRDMFRIKATVTGQITINLRAAAGSSLDTYLRVFNAQGRLLAQNDDHVTLDSRVILNVQAGATYYLEASGYRTSIGAYTLSMSTRASRSALTATPSTARIKAIDAAMIRWIDDAAPRRSLWS